MTKHIHEDALKGSLSIDDAKMEVMPENRPFNGDWRLRCCPKPKAAKMKVRMVKSKVTVKKTSRLENATAHLYDLEDTYEPEKPLNIDLGSTKWKTIKPQTSHLFDILDLFFGKAIISLNRFRQHEQHPCRVTGRT